MLRCYTLHLCPGTLLEMFNVCNGQVSSNDPSWHAIAATPSAELNNTVSLEYPQGFLVSQIVILPETFKI